MNKKIFTVVITAACLAMMTVAMPTDADAQGRYVNVYSRSTVRGYITRLETSSNRFRRDFDRQMDRSLLNGTVTEDRFNGYVIDYENALDTLRQQFNGRNNWWESRSNVQEMLDRAQQVNTMMNGIPFARNLESQWRAMRNDINKVADTYDLPGLNGGGWIGGGGGGNTSSPPSWARGTFYTQSPMDGSQIVLTVANNGQVTSSGAAGTSYGSYYNGTISMEGVSVRVYQVNNGMRTVRNDNGQVVIYSRNNSGGGWGGGNTSRPPSWARGTFYTQSPMDGSQIVLTVANNGQVTSSSSSGTSYGSYYNGTISMEGVSVRVYQVNNGMRTVRNDNGQVVIYSRNSSGGGGGGNQGGNVPSWAVGTFYGRDPQTGGSITLTIDGNGNVSSSAQGAVSYGTINGQNLYMEGVTVRVTRINNGVRTRRTDNGQTVDYNR